VVLLAALIALAGCKSAATTATASPSTSAVKAAHPLPTLDEKEYAENGTKGYIDAMFSLMAEHTKGDDHPMPELIAVTSSRDCAFGDQIFAMGDEHQKNGKSTNGSGAIGACRVDGNPVVMYGPQWVWNLLRIFKSEDLNPQEELTRELLSTYAQYLDLTLGGGQVHTTTCQLGRIMGGLMDAGYLPGGYVDDFANHMSAGNVLIQGAETGKCP
jgi:hypothetical protein